MILKINLKIIKFKSINKQKKKEIKFKKIMIKNCLLKENLKQKSNNRI